MAAGAFAFLDRTRDVAASLVTAARSPGFLQSEADVLVDAAASLWKARNVLLGHFDAPEIRRRRVHGAPQLSDAPAGRAVGMAEAAQLTGLSRTALIRRAEGLRLGVMQDGEWRIRVVDLPRVTELGRARAVRRRA